MANRIFAGTKTVAASGTQEPISSTEQKVACVIIQAKRTNTGYVTVGDSTADYASNLGVNLGVPAADSTPASVVFRSTREANEVDLNKIYLDVETNGEGVTYVCTEA